MLNFSNQVSTVTHQSLNNSSTANFEMPTQWLKSSSGGVVVEMAYVSHFPLVSPDVFVLIFEFCSSGQLLGRLEG